MAISALRRFFASGTSGGIVLALAAVLALILSNSALGPHYEALRQMPGEVRIGHDALVLTKPLLVWVNDLWMAVFFFLVGLEIKRELMEGELATPAQALLPAVAALGGMAVPALIYFAFNHADGVAVRGWAIPAATDIAFALGLVMLLGRRVPASLKVFLTAVAIIDDLGAIVVIAVFFTEGLSTTMLMGAALCIGVLLALNRARVMRVEAYVMVGAVMWLFVLKSGVHATLAGVITALMVPMRDDTGHSPAQQIEHALHPWVAFAVLPLFAFVNAGVALKGVTPEALMSSIPVGIAAGLVLGKTLGVFGSLWLMVTLGLAQRPAAASWMQCLGVSVLCGIGFTMSLFIGGLAFEGQGPGYELQVKLGVLGGSVIAGLIGTLILWRAQGTELRAS
ncbi:MAG: Na+/H+ antiporter NhaA [Ideonella sp. MAG2]|nr:MAG: Na+/H+ antiporter NhaA [Ideonella sp. MAG2]